MGGHIGYVVVPEFRRQGTEILRQALHIAHEQLELVRVLVTCDDDNVGSIRTIDKNAGVLADVVKGSELEKPKSPKVKSEVRVPLPPSSRPHASIGTRPARR